MTDAPAPNASARPWEGRRLHVLGIAGAGMSALAVLARGLGAEVTGSDRAESRYLDGVREAGIAVTIGHDAGNVPAGDDVEVVRSTAIPEDNPERVEARRRGLPDVSRHALLGDVCAAHRVIAVAGAHGKTTTSAMVVHALQGAGEDPSYLVGGILRSTGRNVHVGRSPWLVVEADESDRSFLETRPEIAVVTNVELDHHGTYGSLGELEDAFRTFLAGARERVVWADPSLDRLLPAAGGPARDGAPGGVPQGGATHRYDVATLEARDGASRFVVDGHEVALRQPGLHNARNAAGALTAAALTGADVAAAASAMARFPGTGRRFEQIGVVEGATIVDDYAHHPTEVAATIAAARTLAPRRVVAVFQPHLYSRTRYLGDAFGAALATADVVAVLDVYPARERAEDFPGTDGLTVARAAADHGGGRTVLWLPTIADALARLPSVLRDGDLCLCMGAGDVDAVARGLVGVPAAG
ncbi:UDP-N-acetylmuramate--L-alanine ligase [Patulibacter brassicae]|uniref:UDP-N-acetylmuramate--L-alanine ligase n=1 Tax=Patulibacter brassicae TaxID=1705717 RepID=A0ABU4VQG6_9ACTN|nr:UDP-N-acetylmuramate--L-alanine ligase [Patulibacter brassicae]MDX8153884.1 UDP-N-acetylmuramate--L-alanine ligase [Patulibacter brassicae]